MIYKTFAQGKTVERLWRKAKGSKGIPYDSQLPN
ncbi:hypothetical protein DEHRE_09760 [Dehalobacter restrictus DSM 9455]|uniref:Transposase n=1 Tax=Dehalobacter restrictus (strain DSM 9455 / PER-K23) TaxID=871738 RepID=A0ABM5P9S4_DEHRP|nr:hypothetical protein DEHRE_09760 [Dehalobacter restrictus DSM 9455]